MLEPLSKRSGYDTPTDEPRLLGDRLACGTRYYFAAGVINIVNKARVLANKGEYDNNAWLKSSLEIMKLIEGCGGKFHLRGLDNISTVQGPVLFVSNHMSTLETFVMPGMIVPWMKVTFVVKDSLVKHPFFGPIMRSRDPIVVSRDNPKEDFKIVMQRGRELLSQGISVIIFPQSTRTTTFTPDKFNSLGIKLAKASGVKVIPVAVKTNFWGNGKIVKDFGPIDRSQPICMAFGQPFVVQGSGKEEQGHIIEFIQTHLNEWNKQRF